MRKLDVLVAGSTGYIGVQLVKLLVKHPNINVKYLCGKSSVGKNISFFDSDLKKKNLPKKTCAVCKRQFVWRKKWRLNWEKVRYCSKKCSRNF